MQLIIRLDQVTVCIYYTGELFGYHIFCSDNALRRMPNWMAWKHLLWNMYQTIQR